MGVYIEQIRMPHSCKLCQFAGQCIEGDIRCTLTGDRTNSPSNGRLDSCPLKYKSDKDREIAAYRMAVKSLEAKLGDARRRAKEAQERLRRQDRTSISSSNL